MVAGCTKACHTAAASTDDLPGLAAYHPHNVWSILHSLTWCAGGTEDTEIFYLVGVEVDFFHPATGIESETIMMYVLT
jgi:hypothetical protein